MIDSANFLSHPLSLVCVLVFVAAYCLVIAEDLLSLRKSKPVMVAAGVIWILVAIIYAGSGDNHTAQELFRHNLMEFAELFLFLLVAMTYINTMEERGVFNLLRIKLVTRGFSLRSIYWVTGLLAFSISPIADNLTTALLMATVVCAVGGSNTQFVAIGCINIVVAANAGGAFSPFGDVTTLMVWQKGVLAFDEFFSLLLPSMVNWLVPAIILMFAIPQGQPEPVPETRFKLRHGAWVIIVLFLITISLAVSVHTFFHLPPVLGMTTGLGLLKFYGYSLQLRDARRSKRAMARDSEINVGEHEVRLETTERGPEVTQKAKEHFNIFRSLERAEWDTLMFFYGIILCVGGLSALGYLALMSELMYVDLGASTANILVGLLSAVLDNIPVMFAVLAMSPEMSDGQWLLVTLTAGVGGSLLSIGSAAGVAVMGTARGIYTFWAHLKWSWAIGLGYAASVAVHFWVNADKF